MGHRTWPEQPLVSSRRRSDRLLVILNSLSQEKGSSVEETARMLGVSSATIRRDFAALEEQGLVLRARGGARRRPGLAEVPVQLRHHQARETKWRIAARVADMVPAGQHALAMTGGTTTMEIARMLKRRTRLTIVTNSLTIALEVASSPTGRVIITGGYVRNASLEAVGGLAESTYRTLPVHDAILGVDGISAAGGATTHNDVEARISGAMIEGAKRVIVVADGSKVAKTALAQMLPCSSIDILVTDASADPVEIESLRRLGVSVEVVS